MEQENGEMNVCNTGSGMCGGKCGMGCGCGCGGFGFGHGHKHLIKTLIKIAIVAAIFCFAFKMGELKGMLENHGFYGHDRYGMMDAYYYGNDVGAPATTPATPAQ